MEIHILSHVEAIFGILVFAFLFFIISKATTRKNSKKFGPPPPELPGGWPIIGHLPQILNDTLDGRSRSKDTDGEIPLAHTLAALADKYGPVFTVRQGMFTIAVVSSYEAIKECFTTQDKNLANRVATCSCKYLGYDHANLTFANYGPYWRMVRKLVVNNLLSSKSLERLKHVRISEVESSIKDLYTFFVANQAKNVPTKVDIGHWFDDMMLNITVKMIGGKRYSQVGDKEEEKEEAERFRKAFNETMYYLALVGIEDAFPIPLLQWLDLQGNIKVMKRIADEMDVILQRWLDDHTNKRKMMNDQSINGDDDDQDLIDIMLTELNEDDFQYGYSRETIIKATMLTIVSDATHTTAVHLIWIIACLLNNKHVLQKVQEEIDTKVGRDRWAEDSDIKNLVYFQATIKEVLRLYPPSPMLVHEALADCQVLGYHIPKGTRLFVNVWKLQKDPKFWPEPDKFLPERFLTTKANVDVYGKDLEFIPFGSGRRSCPGITMAMQVTYLSIARLLQAFDFETPDNGPIDMTEGPGFTAVKKTPLEVVVKPRMLPLYYGV